MPITGIDFVNMTKKEMEALFLVPDPICGICNSSIKPCENIQYIRDNRNEKQLAHEDCYYSEFSKELDKHPIGIPRMHRGA